MQAKKPQPDECVILIKAQPHRSSKYFETVCCAGVGRDQRWRRQYPIPFRILNDSQKFGRWQWISYNYVVPEDDKRLESQKVLAETIKPTTILKASERAQSLAPLVRETFDEATSKRESLTLIRPRSISLSAIEKSERRLAKESERHRALSNQLSFFGNSAEPLKLCPMSFVLSWTDQRNVQHRHECDDWETSSAFNRFEQTYGQKRAVEIIKEKYEQQYFNTGLVLSFSTHSRRNIECGTVNQWLLVGLIRLDDESQGHLAF